MQVLPFLVALCSILLQSSNAQQVFVFPWNGTDDPVEVPVDFFSVMPPNRVVIEFSDDGTVRTLRVAEGVITTFDCSRVVTALTTMPNVFIAPTSVMTDWTVRIYDNDLVPGDSRPVNDDDTYDISGMFMEILNITNPSLPVGAAEGEWGEYTCEACGNTVVVGGTPVEMCLQSTTNFLITAPPPTINETPGSSIVSDYLRYQIGNDICVTLPAAPDFFGIDILCTQDPNFVIPRDPVPDATWAFNGMSIGTNDNTFILGVDFVGPNPQVGNNGLLTIDDIDSLQPSQYVGEYRCNLSTIHGQDSSSTLLVVNDIMISLDNGRADDGCARLQISSEPNTFCAVPGEAFTINCQSSQGYTITAPGGAQTGDQSLTVSSATGADAGTYICLSGPPCSDRRNVTVIISESVPVIVDGPETVMSPDTVIYNIGNDLCILSSNPQNIIILCGHDNNGMINPIPAATWTVPSTASDIAGALSFFDSAERIGTNDALRIDNDGDPVRFVVRLQGTYTCELSNGIGTDTAMTQIRVFPNINTGNGKFELDPPEGRVAVGNATCRNRRGEVGADQIQIRCLPIESGTFETQWLYNGVVIPGETRSTIPNMGPGVYTCIQSNDCGSVNASTSVLDRPLFDVPVTTPTDGPNVIFNIGQSVCINPTLGGSARLECPLPPNADPEFTSMVWSKAGDPDFSFSGTVLSLSRTDPASAGTYTCMILSGPDGACGIASESSNVTIQSTLTTGSGFVPDPPGNVLTIGSNTCLQPSLRIRCQTTPPTSATWTLDGASVIGGEFIDVTLPGVYECTASDGCGQTLTGRSEVLTNNLIAISAAISGQADSGCSRVRDAPDNVDSCPLMGETVTISCVTVPVIDYTIRMGGNVLSVNQALVVTNFGDDDYGTYECVGMGNECGTPMDSLIVFSGGIPPVIPPGGDRPLTFRNVSVGDNTCLPAGQMVSIDCEATSGTLPIAYEWRKEPSEEVISTMTRITVTETGTYTCSATNRVGTANGSSTVFEEIEMDFRISASNVPSRCQDLDVPPSYTDLCFFTGDFVVFSCRTQASMSPGIIQPGDVMETLVIRDLQERDIMFSCTGMNDCGNDTASLILLVQEPARIDRTSPLPPGSDTDMNIGAGRPDEPVEILENVTVRLYCPFTGLDQPSTRWVRVNRDRTTTDVVEMPPDVVFINETNNIILVINSFSESFEGTFRCVTDNNAGDDDGDVVLRLGAPEPGEWSTTPWSACDPDCHRGMRMRQVLCRGVNTRFLFPDNRCTDEKPLTMEQCLDRGPCFLDPVWVAQDWSPCSADCNGGYRTRDIICQIPRTQEIVSDNQCQPHAEPSSYEFCNMQSCCRGDRYPAYCRLVRNTPMCSMAAVKENCCWSCR